MNRYLNLARGIDISFYQSQMQTDPDIEPDFDVIASKFDYMFIRAGINTQADVKYKLNWESSRGKIARGPYWFYGWAQSLGSSAKEQAKAFNYVTGLDWGELQPVMDFECYPFPSRDNALKIIYDFRVTVQYTGKMLLYINQSDLESLTPLPDWLLEMFDLWIAAPPLFIDASGVKRQPKTVEEIPDGWKPDTQGWDWKYWQYSWKLDGIASGVQSKDLDGDLCAMTKEELYSEINWQQPEEPQPDEEPEDEGENMTDNSLIYGLGFDESSQKISEIWEDFVVIFGADIGGRDDNGEPIINDRLKEQIEDAQAAGSAVILLVKVHPGYYVTRGEGMDRTKWKVDEDALIAGLDQERAYLDRVAKRPGIHAIMIEPSIYEDEAKTKVIKPSWWLEVTKYYIELVNDRYNLPAYFVFIRPGDLQKLRDKQENSEIDLFIKDYVGTLSTVKLGDEPVYTGLGFTPDLLYYDRDDDLSISYWASRYYDQSGFYSMLNFTPSEAVEDEPEQEPDEEPEDDPEWLNDPEQLDRIEEKLDAILDFIDRLRS